MPNTPVKYEVLSKQYLRSILDISGNVSFRISLRWTIHIINPVDKTKLSCNTPTDAAPQKLAPLIRLFRKSILVLTLLYLKH